jgi:hypothetical protein
MDGFVKGGSGSGSSQPKIHKITEASNLLLPKAASLQAYDQQPKECISAHSDLKH